MEYEFLMDSMEVEYLFGTKVIVFLRHTFIE